MVTNQTVAEPREPPSFRHAREKLVTIMVTNQITTTAQSQLRNRPETHFNVTNMVTNIAVTGWSYAGQLSRGDWGKVTIRDASSLRHLLD